MTMTFGLSNFGTPLERNICFINSILQLLHCVSVIRNLVKKRAYKSTPETLTPVCDELSRIFNYQGDVTSAGPLRELLGAKKGLSYVMAGEQEDASMFLRHLLDQIFQEVDPDARLEELINITIAHQACFNTPDGACNKCGYISPPDENNRKVLVLQESSESSSLQDLIQFYFQDQNLENFRCGNEGYCQDADSRNVKEATMRQTVTKLPEILFIQVQKTVNITVNEGFFTVQGVRFEINGIVDHLGMDINSGYYIGFRSKLLPCDQSMPDP